MTRISSSPSQPRPDLQGPNTESAQPTPDSTGATARVHGDIVVPPSQAQIPGVADRDPQVIRHFVRDQRAPLAEPSSEGHRGAVGTRRKVIGLLGALQVDRNEAAPKGSPLFQSAVQAALSASQPGTTGAHKALVSTHNWAGAEVMIEPKKIFQHYGSLIENAEHDVAVQTFAWDKDSQPVKEVFAALQRLQAKRKAEGATRPVKVRVMIDTMGSGLNQNTTTQDIFLEMRLLRSEYGLDPKYVDLEVGAYDHKLLGSLHSKGLVVDGKVGVITGANMNKHDNWETGEHDAAFTVGGEVAHTMLSDFDDAWLKSRVWVAGDYGWGTPWTRPIPMIEATRVPRHVVHDIEQTPRLPADKQIPMMVVGKQAHDGLTPPENADYPLNRVYLSMLKGAKNEIHIQTPNLNEGQIKDALIEAIKRGVTVKMVLSKRYEEFTESLPWQGGTNQENIDELRGHLKEAGVQNLPEKLQIRWYRHDPSQPQPVEGNSAKASHVKYLAVDGQVTLVTSLNNDTQSWRSSREIGVVVDDAATTQRWGQQIFDVDFGKGVPAD